MLASEKRSSLLQSQIFFNLFLVQSMTKEICGSLATATQHKGMIIDTNLGPVL